MADGDGIFFAGQPVLLDIDATLRTYLETRWPPERWPHARERLTHKPTPFPFFRKNRAGMFVSPYPECPAPKVNELIVPTGASRYARALVVVDRESLQGIAAEIWDLTIDLSTTDPPESWGDSSYSANLVFQYDGSEFYRPMFALAPSKIATTGTHDDLWLLPLVDERYFWNRSAVAIADVETWDELIAEIGSWLGIGLELSTPIDGAYGVPDRECLLEADANWGEIIDAIALSTGKRFSGKRTPGVGGDIYTITDATIDTNTVNSSLLLLSDMRLGGSAPITAIQRSVALVTRKAFDYWGAADELDIYEADIDADSNSSVKLVVFSAWWLEYFTDEYTGLPVVDGSSQIYRNALGDQIAADHLAWGGKQYAASYAGVAEWQLTGHDDYVSIACGPSPAGEMSITTHVVSLPPDFGPRVSIAQRADRYIHPHEVARFEVTGSHTGTRAPALIFKADGPYEDGDVESVAVVMAVDSAVMSAVITCHYEHGIGWMEIAGGSGVNATKIKFRATADIANRTLPAVVLHAAGTALSVGDPLNVYDPNNLWGAATATCIGTAYYNDTRGQWEIETCSLPASEIEATLTEVLPAVAGTYTALTSASYFLRSTYPNVMKPPQCSSSCTYTWNVSLQSWEITTPCSEGCECGAVPADPVDTDTPGQTIEVPCSIYDEDTIEIEFENTWLLDAMCDSKVILRRISNASWGLPAESAPDPDGSATEFRWEIVQAARRKARWIKYTFEGPSAAPEVEDAWDGIDPSVCGAIDIDYPLGVPCIGDTVIASYDPEGDLYKALDTRASMLGEPTNIALVANVANHDCGVTLTKYLLQSFVQNEDGECQSEPQFSDVALGTSVPIVQSIAADDGCSFNYVKQNARVFLCGSESSVLTVDLATTDVAVITGMEFGPPPCTEAVYTSVSDGEFGWRWEETTPCAAGCSSTPPMELPTGSGLTATVPCIAGSGTGCGINYTTTTVKVCGTGGGGGGHAMLDLIPITVVEDVTKQPTGIMVDHATVYVCNYTQAASTLIPTTSCDGGGSGGPCTGSARYGWNTITQAWVLISACANGCTSVDPVEPPEDPETYTEIDVSCVEDA